MAEPTDISKNMGTAEKMVQNGTLAFRQYMDIPYIPEEEEFLFEEFGGKPGQGRIKTPKKLTVKQAFALLDYSGFPLADENAKFSIASSIKLSAPELFDDASFKDYEKKFGKVMEMQEKGASASKNITTAKTPVAANESTPSKKDPTQITLREAADAYNARGAGKVARFGPKGALKEYGNMPLVQAFTPDESGVRPIDKMLEGTKSQGAANSLQDDLRLISKDVNRQIFNADPKSPALNLLPGLESNDPQTFNIFGERVSAPKQTEIAVIAQNKQGWGEFMQQLNAIREGGGNDAVIADAIYVNLQTGYRSGAVAGLTGAEYKVDRGTIEITPQTKATPDAEKRKGAQKVGGARKQAIPQDVPLNEQSHARLQQRLAANQQDVGIRSFIEDKIKAGKAAPVFVIKGKDGKYRQLKTDDMTEVLSRIKTSTPIIKDNITNKEFNTLVPDDPKYSGEDKKGKFGAALLRNVFANVAAFEVQMPDTMLDFLQGRSQKSGAETRSKTAKSGYLVRPRGTFYPAERDAAQSVGNWFDQVEGADVSQRFDPETQTVRGATYGIPGMFDQPTAAAMPEPATPVVKPEPTSLGDLSPETKDAMTKAGFKIDWSNLSVGALSGLGIYAALSDPAQAATDIALETGARAVGFGMGPAAAVPMIMTPTELASGELQEGDRMATQEELMAQVEQRAAQEAAVRERDIRAEAAMQQGDSFLTMQP
jgi:hypothetical protein